MVIVNEVLINFIYVSSIFVVDVKVFLLEKVSTVNSVYYIPDTTSFF